MGDVGKAKMPTTVQEWYDLLSTAPESEWPENWEALYRTELDKVWNFEGRAREDEERRLMLEEDEREEVERCLGQGDEAREEKELCLEQEEGCYPEEEERGRRRTVKRYYQR